MKQEEGRNASEREQEEGRKCVLILDAPQKLNQKCEMAGQRNVRWSGREIKGKRISFLSLELLFGDR
jgi:hypothetical protein